MFLSYDPATDGPFARRFGALLATFARRRFGPARRPALRSAARSTESLADSTWLVLLASPEAARSPLVADEVGWWLDRHGTDRLLIGLVRGGDMSWSGHRPADGTDTLPPELVARLRTEPKWVDLRDLARLHPLDAGNALVHDALATFAARLHGVEKDELIGEHVRRERLARRLTRATLGTLTVLLGVALALTGVAVGGAVRAAEGARAADARLLAATALAVTETDAERAVLLAAEGYRLHPDTQTFTALLRSVEATGPLGRRVDLGSDVVSLAAAPPATDDTDDTEADDEPGVVVAGTADGEVWRWRLDGEPKRLASLGDPVTEIAVSADGETVVAMAGTRAWVSTDTARPGLAGLTGVQDVAVDPEGDRLAVIVWDETTHDLLLLDAQDGAPVSSADLSGTSLGAVAVTGEAVVVAQRRVPSGSGHWQRRTVPDLEVVSEAGVTESLNGEFTEHDLSADGAWVTAFRAGTVVGVDTRHTALYEKSAPDSLGTLLPVAATPSGDEAGRLLLSRRDQTWVTELPVLRNPRAWPLHGMPTADTGAFVDEDRLVTAHGTVLAAWDLDAASPLTHSAEIDWSYLDDTALSPDGTTVATGGAAALGEHGENYGTVATYPTGGDDGERRYPTFHAVEPGHVSDRLIPVPLDDGRVLVVTPQDGTVREATGDLSAEELASPVPLHPLESRYATGLRSVRAARVVDDRLVLADAYGRVQVRDVTGGRLLHDATATHAPTSEAWGVGAAISPDGRYVALHDLSPFGRTTREATISVLDLRHSVTRTITVPARQNITHLGTSTSAAVLDLTYGEGELLVSQADGVLVVEPDGSAVRTRIDSVVGSTAAFTRQGLAPVPGTSLVAQAGELDWIQLYDTRTGHRVGSLTPPDAGGSLDNLWLGAGPDSLLALSGWDAVRWDLRPEAVVADACEFAARDLTAAEWLQTVDTTPPDDLTCARDL